VLIFSDFSPTDRTSEYLPIIKRWELEPEGWRNVRFPLNKGATRDIPPNAVIHESLLWRLYNDASYIPGNNHGGSTALCLPKKDVTAAFQKIQDDEGKDLDYEAYIFKDAK
jgi:hypothetical protein